MPISNPPIVSASTFTGILLPINGGTGIANNNASTLTISGSFTTTLTISAATALTLPTSGVVFSDKSASITSAQFLSACSDETGTGVLVFGTSPTFTTQIITPLIYGGSGASGTLTIDATSNGTKGAVIFGTAGTSNLYNFNTGSGTTLFTIREKVGTANSVALYINVASGSESSTNYFVNYNGVMNINTQTSTGTMSLKAGDAAFYTATMTNSSSTAQHQWSATARTSLGTTANVPVYQFSANTLTWVAGTIPLQYFAWFKSQTLAFASASTASLVAGLAVDYTTRGANATITLQGAIYVPTAVLTTNTATAAGIIIDQSSGATNNFASMLRFDSSNYFTTALNSTGNVTLALTGTTPLFTFSNGIILPASSATALMYPLKYTGGGSVLTTAVAGVSEYNNSFYLTKNSTLRFGLGGVIFDNSADAANGTTVETDLYTYTTPANTLASNGEKIQAEYGGVFVSSGTATREIKLYFAGTVIFDTGALTLSLSSAWTMYVTIIRVSATVIRYSISFTTEGAALAAYTAVGELTGLTLSNTNIIKITGQAAGIGAATGDITAKLGYGAWFAPANN